MRLGLRSVLAVAMLAILPASAQERPNFSGEWVRVEPPADAASVLTVEQTDDFIEIRPLSLSGPRPGRYRFDVFEGSADGTMHSGAVSLQSSSALWTDASLVVTEKRSISQAGIATHQSRHEEVWSLGPKNLLTVVITDEETGAAPTTTRFVYRKRR